MGDKKQINSIGSMDSVSSKIFWGLVLTFFHINLFGLHLDTYLPIIGLCLLITAAWQLRHETKQFRYMFITGIIQFVIMIFGFVISGSKLSQESTVIYWFLFISNFFSIATYCWLFSGIAQLVWKIYNIEKDKVEETEKITPVLEKGEDSSIRDMIATDVVAEKVRNCCFIYIIISIAMLICLFAPPITLFTLPLIIILVIVLLIRVNRALGIAKQSNTAYQIQKLNLKYYLSGISIVILSVVICLSTLLYVNSPRPKSQLFQQNNNLDHVQAIKIRKQMLQMNYDRDILNNLPDSEIMRYEGVQFCQRNREDMEVDGGILRLSICTASFKDMSMRVLLYYNWIKPPHHNYTDVISYSLPNNLVAPNNEVLYSEILFEKSGKKYITSALESDYGPVYKAMKFRLWGKDHKNQQGYIVFNTYWSRDEAMSINIIMDYIHQSSMFNVPYQDNLDMNKVRGTDFMLDMSTRSESSIFQNYSFMALIHSDKESTLDN